MKQVTITFLLDLLINQVFVLEDEINLSSCCWSLQLLPVQHLLLQFLNGLSQTCNSKCKSLFKKRATRPTKLQSAVNMK